MIQASYIFISKDNDASRNYRGGKWAGNESCSDSQKLFESVVYKLEDLMVNLQYKYFSSDVDDYVENNPTLPNDLWSQTDSRGSDSESRGRCFTTIPTNKHIKLGIQEITLSVGEYVTVYIHTPGMFITAKAKSEMLQGFYINAKSGGFYEIDVKHDLYNVLGNDGAACAPDQTYSKDACANENVEKISIAAYGCHSPFGPNKTQICQDPDKATQVLGIYAEEIEKHNSKCLDPCSFFSIMSMKTKVVKQACFALFCPKNNMLKFSFKENIKVTKGYYLYSGLSLIAEVGGYVGLFLGVSVNQISNLFQWILNKINLL